MAENGYSRRYHQSQQEAGRSFQAGTRTQQSYPQPPSNFAYSGSESMEPPECNTYDYPVISPYQKQHSAASYQNMPTYMNSEMEYRNEPRAAYSQSRSHTRHNSYTPPHVIVPHSAPAGSEMSQHAIDYSGYSHSFNSSPMRSTRHPSFGSHSSHPFSQSDGTLYQSDSPYQQRQLRQNTFQSSSNSAYAIPPPKRPLSYSGSFMSKSSKKNKPCCKCCCNSRIGCCICTIVILLLLTVAGFVIFFLVGVKIPEVRYTGSERPPDVESRPIVSFEGNTLKLNWNILLGIKNENGFSIDLYEINMKGFADDARSIQIANGTLFDTSIRSSTTTNLSFPVTFNYNPTTHSRFLNTVFAACGVPSPSNPTATQSGPKPLIPLWYEIKLGFKVIQFLPYQYSYKDKADVQCPIDLSSATGVLNILRNFGFIGRSTASANRVVESTERQMMKRSEEDVVLLDGKEIDIHQLNDTEKIDLLNKLIRKAYKL